MVKRKCLNCGKEFAVQPFKVKNGGGIYCSKSCAYSSKERSKKIGDKRRGSKHSEESKRRMSEIKKGKHLSPETEFKKGLIPWNKGTKGLTSGWLKGKKMSEEQKEKLSKIWKEKFKDPRNHPRWQGGITPLNFQIRNSEEYQSWRIQIFENNNFVCQKCGQRAGKLQAHHIENFSLITHKNNINILRDALNCEELWNINNGITFCKECHILFHKIYGKWNNAKEQLEEFLEKEF